MSGTFTRIAEWTGRDLRAVPVDCEHFSLFTLFPDSGFSVINYGFRPRLDLAPEHQLAVRDLWAWLKRLIEPLRRGCDREVVKNIMENLLTLCRGPTLRHRDYVVCAEDERIFLSIFSNAFRKNREALKKAEFSRFIFWTAVTFEYEEAIAAIEERERAKPPPDRAHLREARYIRNVMRGAEQQRPWSEEARELWQACVFNEELEDPYLRLIQLFLSKRYLSTPSEIFFLRGIHFSDRLYFVVRFLTAQAEALIADYLRSACSLEMIPLLAMDAEAISRILQRHLDEAHDVVTVGLAAKCIAHVFGYAQMAPFAAALDGLLDLYGLEEVRIAVAQQLRPEKPAEGADCALFCYYCQRPGLPERAAAPGTHARKFCAHCFKRRCRCSVCLDALGVSAEAPAQGSKAAEGKLPAAKQSKLSHKLRHLVHELQPRRPLRAPAGVVLLQRHLRRSPLPVQVRPNVSRRLRPGG